MLNSKSYLLNTHSCETLCFKNIVITLFFLRVCPWENQAGGDTAQITDFAQTWYKCSVWWVNDYGKNLG